MPNLPVSVAKPAGRIVSLWAAVYIESSDPHLFRMRLFNIGNLHPHMVSVDLKKGVWRVLDYSGRQEKKEYQIGWSIRVPTKRMPGGVAFVFDRSNPEHLTMLGYFEMEFLTVA